MIQIDMEMPKCCDECFALDEHGDYPYCLISQDQRGYTFNTREKRMPTCPLKAQEPKVATWEEAQANVQDGPFIIIEVRDSTGSEMDFGVLAGDFYEMSDGSVLTVADFGMLKDYYGKQFRLWTFRPTDEQREAISWNAQK